jgi:glycosyltransferase involved in cell wall biosynthesis
MSQPVFGFLAFTSGSFEGAIIRDMHLANDLHRRGHKVVVYWMMERNADLVDKGILQRRLVGGMRYQLKKPHGFFEKLGNALALFPAQKRREFMQRHPDYVDRLMGNFCRCICAGGESDRTIVDRLIRFMRMDGVTHLLPTFAMICPFALAAKQRNTHPFDYLVTFQGEEIFANYAQQIGRLDDYHQRLRECVAGSPWPAVAVSRDYIGRLHEEMGIDPDRLRPIYPGIELPRNATPPPFEVLRPKFKNLTRDLPIVTYIGRQDSEKGIDLLLYAAKMLQERGIKMQLVICGGTSFGQRYRDVISHIAQHLRVPIHHRRRIPSEMRDALYAYSRCIVYPSIHREPFGMVAAEAMSYGTPVLVPNCGGITEAIQWNGQAGGLTFNVWDTADLARQLERLVVDDELHRTLSANTRTVAANFTVQRMTDRVLEHLGIGQESVTATTAPPSPHR